MGARGCGALPRHVPKPLQPGSCLASVTDHHGREGPPHTHLCPTLLLVGRIEAPHPQWPGLLCMLLCQKNKSCYFDSSCCSEAIRKSTMLYVLYGKCSVAFSES